MFIFKFYIEIVCTVLTLRKQKNDLLAKMYLTLYNAFCVVFSTATVISNSICTKGFVRYLLILFENSRVYHAMGRRRWIAVKLTSDLLVLAFALLTWDNAVASVRINGVDCGDGIWIAVCDSDPLVLKSVDSGETWTQCSVLLPQGLPDLGLRQVCHAGRGTWYACGFSGAPGNGTEVVLRSSDNGDNWEYLCEPDGSQPLNGIAFLSDQIGFTAGGVPFTGCIYMTVDGGMNWSLETGLQGANWGDIDATSMQCVIAVGSISSEQSLAEKEAIIARRVENGEYWDIVLQGIPGHFISVQALGPLWFAAGDNALLYRSEDDGRTWNELPGDFPSNFIFRGVHFSDAINGTILGYIQGNENSGLLYTTSDGGLSWIEHSELDNSGLSRLNEVVSNTGQDWVAVGIRSQIIRSSNFMNRWVRVFWEQTKSMEEEHQAVSPLSSLESREGRSLFVRTSPSCSSSIELSVFDLAGRRVHSQSIPSGEETLVDLRFCRNGVYLIVAVSDSRVLSMKTVLHDW